MIQAQLPVLLFRYTVSVNIAYTNSVMAKWTKEEKNEALETLRKMLKPGDVVYTILRHVSSSGMSRIIDLVIPCEDGTGKPEIRSIGWLAARAMDDNFANDRYYGIKVSGCGMDMGFSVVYNLGRTLFPQGFELAPEQHGRNGDTSGHDNDGGYALRQVWL